jgi:hypothetical protein
MHLDEIPDEMLNLEYDAEEVWMIGGDLCLSLVLATDLENYNMSKPIR